MSRIADQNGPMGPLGELTTALQRLPGIGARSAQRLAYHLLKTPREEVDALCAALLSVKMRVTYCTVCNNITDVDPCAYCTAEDRDSRIICVVEQPENVAAIEKTRGFRGRYHVLMGAIAPLQGIGPDDLKMRGLISRVGEGGVEEVILATNPTVEGEATALYLARLIKPLGPRVTRIAMGVPVGSDIDYTDEFTMSKSMEGRREILAGVRSPPMTIRKSLASDAAAIDVMFREFVAELRAVGDTNLYEFGAAQYLRDAFGADPVLRGLIAEDASGPAGYLLFARNYEGDYTRALYVVDLFVRSPARGSGVARLLMDAVADVARTEGLARLTWSVHRNNARARRFYEKLGASLVDDSDVMWLDV